MQRGQSPKMPFSLLSVLVITGLGLVHSFPSGPPASPGVCDMLQPGVGPAQHGPDPVNAGNGGFVIATNLSLNTSEGFYTYDEGIRYTGKPRRDEHWV